MSNLTQKKIEAEKNGDKDRKTLHKLINNAVYVKRWKSSEIALM